MQTRFWTRISFAALTFAVLAGAFTGGMLVNANTDAQPTEPPPSPRTAYVDFLSLLKRDAPLKREQQTIQLKVEQQINRIDKRYLAQIDAQQKIKNENKVDTREYRLAMQKQLDFERRRYQEKLEVEQIAQADLRNYGIERFKKLRNLTHDIARKRGYSQVLNIVRDIEDVAGAQDDFQALQQQLLVSPVLYYETEHDLTDVVDAAAQAQWGETITFIAWDEDAKRGGISFKVSGEGGEFVKRNADGDYEIRLGGSGAFGIEILDKGEPAQGERAEVRWSKTGLNNGEIDEDTGAYTAPAEFPLNDLFVVTVRSAVDPTVVERVRIRLVDKEGKRKPAQEEPKDTPEEE